MILRLYGQPVRRLPLAKREEAERAVQEEREQDVIEPSASPWSSPIVLYCTPMCISGKITTVPRLFSEHLLQDENKHQIMNVHTKWNCLIPILSGLVKY